MPAEKTFFSCPAAKKIVSFCTTADTRTYRFGKPKKIEMAYTGGVVDQKFSRTSVLGASNAANIISFTNKNVEYQLISPMRGGPFLEVRKGDKMLADIACENGWAKTVGDPDQSSPFIKEPAMDESKEQEKKMSALDAGYLASQHIAVQGDLVSARHVADTTGEHVLVLSRKHDRDAIQLNAAYFTNRAGGRNGSSATASIAPAWTRTPASSPPPSPSPI